MVLADDSPLWPQLTNYEPFLCTEAADLLFTLEVQSSAEPLFCEERAEHVLTDKSDADMPRIELYRQDDGFIFRISVFRDSEVCCELQTSADFSSGRLCILPVVKSSGRFPVDNALMLLYAFCTARKGTLEMHASVVMRGGKAYMFLGKSGTGKSTHSRQWLETFPDAVLLNDDNPIVRLTPCTDTDTEVRSALTTDGLCPYVYGSPWSGKTPCYKNLSAPVAGIVLLRQAPHNTLQHLSLGEAYAAVYSSSSGLRCLPALADGLHGTVAELVQSTGCYLLDCLPDHAAARVCCEGIG